MRIADSLPGTLLRKGQSGTLALLLVVTTGGGLAFPDPSPTPTPIADETPAPSPSPTPVPDPLLTDVTKNWKLLKVSQEAVHFIHTQTKAEHLAKVGEHIVCPAGRKSIRVIVESVDAKKQSATFRYEGAQGVQTETLTVADAEE